MTPVVTGDPATLRRRTASGNRSAPIQSDPLAFGYARGDAGSLHRCEARPAEICSWMTMEGPTPVELGTRLPLGLVEDVPSDVEMVCPPEALAAIPLPAEARAALGLEHLTINWEAHVHPPASFLHFDFHFYNVSEDAVAAIDCADVSKPTALPDIDVPGMGRFIGLCVPTVGIHAMPESDVASTNPSEASMIVGYYGGAPIFLEPMVSRW